MYRIRYWSKDHSGIWGTYPTLKDAQHALWLLWRDAYERKVGNIAYRPDSFLRLWDSCSYYLIYHD